VIASIESQLGGQAEFDWHPEGLVCRLSVPMSPHVAVQDRNPRHHAAVNKPSPGRIVRSADA
jgi:hypothetical protein